MIYPGSRQTIPRIRATALLVAGATLLSLLHWLLGGAGPARAATQYWTISTREEFLQGSLVNVTAYIDYLELSPSSSFSLTSTPSGTYDLRGVAMLSGLDAWAVGTGGTILRWNGSSWSNVPSPTTNHLYSVSMVSASDGWAVGQNGRIIRWNGSSWTVVSSPNTTDLWAVDMLASNNGWAVGVDPCFFSNCNILRWNGTSWSRVTSPTSSTLFGLDMVNNVDGWAVGQNGRIIRWSGSSWSNFTSPTTNTLYGVSMASPTFGFSVGAQGTILRWDGASWTRLQSPANPVDGNSNVTLRAVKTQSENLAWAAGYDAGSGKSVVLKWNGTSWTRISPDPASVTLYALSLSGDGKAGLFVGGSRTALRYGGYCGGDGPSCSGTATYTFDAGQTVDWQSHTYAADTLAGVTSVSFRFASSDDGSTWSTWQNSLSAVSNSRYLKKEITLSTSDWTKTPRLYVSSVSFSTLAAYGPAWIPVAGPHDLRTQTESGQVKLVFTPRTGETTTYTVYRHAYEDDRGATVLGSATTDSSGQLTSASPSDSWSQSDPDYPGRLVFTDTSVENFKEYYYFVTDGPFTGELRDYIVVPAFPPTQLPHGNFAENTSACTACHGLHSSRSQLPGRGKLLKAPTATDLCRNCHDGSGSKYDEVNGRVRVDVDWSAYTEALAGPYGQLLTGEGSAPAEVTPTSVHSLGQVVLNQAPGSGMPFSPVTWLQQLSCISCHEPHNKFRNYRALRGSIHFGNHVRVRGYSEVHWTQPTKSDATSYQKYIAGINDFCGQCHVYFADDRLGNVDKTPSDSAVAQNVYGKYRHPVGIPVSLYLEMGKKTVVMNVYGYDYPFEDADPSRQLLPNRDLPLEGPHSGSRYNDNVIVCLTCHMAHGTLKPGQKQVAYLNGAANNTVGASKMDKYGGYTDRYAALNDEPGGGSTVLMRTGGVGVCQKCHQKNYVPKQWFFDGTSDLWCEQNVSCGGGVPGG